jgi:hypothetical protein
MDKAPQRISRRGLLAATAAGSAITLAGPVAAHAGPAASSVPAAVPEGPLVTRDRIATAVTRRPDGRAVAMRYSADFHERLAEWLRFWWANAPGEWVSPLEIVGEVDTSGRAFLLSGIRYTRLDRPGVGFDAGTRGGAYWAGLASLHHHFPVVRGVADGVLVGDGSPGFTGSAEQVAFIEGAARTVWGVPEATGWDSAGARVLGRAGGPSEVTSRSGWRAFTRATMRRGLGTESY